MNRLILTLAALTLSASAHAADMSAPILDLDDKPVPDCELASDFPKGCAGAPTLTLGVVAKRALIQDYPDEAADPRSGRPGVTAEEKFDRVELARTLKRDPKFALDAKTVQKIKDLVAKRWSAVVVDAAWRMLDPALIKDMKAP